MKSLPFFVIALCIGFVVGCSTPAKKVKDLSLGMTPEDVLDAIDKPYTVRAAKVYEDGQSTEVWEYRSRFGFDVTDYWLYFENGRLVQWGQPGDFTGNKSLIQEYKAYKQAR